MLYLNPLPRAVLITPDEVIRQASTDDKLDPRKVLNAIEIAEKRFVRAALGWEFYDLLCAQKNTEVTVLNQAALQGLIDTTYGTGQVTIQPGDFVNSSSYLTSSNRLLWNNELWKYCAECVRFIAMPEVYANMTSQGIMKNHPTIGGAAGAGGESASVSLSDMKWLMDKWIGDRIDTLETSLHEYISRNIGHYPSYGRAAECLAGNAAASEGTRRLGWISNMYDDDDECGCDVMQGRPAPVVPNTQARPTVGRIQFIAAAGQNAYPLIGQSDETEVRQELIGSSLISFTIEGIELFEGSGPGEMQGLDPVTGTITWNEPSQNPVRCIIKYEKI